MGMTYLDVDVSNPTTPAKRESVHFLIDSGAVFSVVPAATLKKLGIKPTDSRTFTLANGQQITRKMGGAMFRYSNATGHAAVIFGEPGDHALLGAHTLEALGLALDPLKRELRPLPMVLG